MIEDTRPSDPRIEPGSYERKGSKTVRTDKPFEAVDVAEGRAPLVDGKAAKATQEALEAAGFPPAPTIETAPEPAKPAPATTTPPPPAEGGGKH